MFDYIIVYYIKSVSVFSKIEFQSDVNDAEEVEAEFIESIGADTARDTVVVAIVDFSMEEVFIKNEDF